MDKERLNQLIEKFESGIISAEEIQLLEKAIEEGKIEPEELTTIREMSSRLDFDIPEPGENLRSGFYENLAREKARRTRGNFLAGINTWLTHLGWSPAAIRWAYSTLLVVVGFGVGQWTQTGGESETRIDALSQQVSEMRELIMLSLINEPVATQRLKAVNLAMDAQNVDDKVIHALLNTLNTDENVNVRLAAVEVLLRYTGNPVVRQGLVEAIPNQKNATIQYALAEVMVIIHEKKSVEKLQELLNQENVEEGVKDKIKESIQKLS